jgi:hypothetical protein
MASEAKRLRRALDVLTGADGPPASAGFPAPSAAPDGQLFLASLEARDAARPWTEDPNIQGLGMADRITAGRRESELALKVYVERKLPMSRVENPVPAELEIPGVDGTLATDVEEIGRVELEAATGRFRPACRAHARRFPHAPLHADRRGWDPGLRLATRRERRIGRRVAGDPVDSMP